MRDEFPRRGTCMRSPCAGSARSCSAIRCRRSAAPPLLGPASVESTLPGICRSRTSAGLVGLVVAQFPAAFLIERPHGVVGHRAPLEGREPDGCRDEAACTAAVGRPDIWACRFVPGAGRWRRGSAGRSRRRRSGALRGRRGLSGGAGWPATRPGPWAKACAGRCGLGPIPPVRRWSIWTANWTASSQPARRAEQAARV